MTRFAFTARATAPAHVRERPARGGGGWPDAVPWDPSYDSRACLGPYRDPADLAPGAVLASVAVQATLFAAAAEALPAPPGYGSGQGAGPARVAARRLARATGSLRLRNACGRVLDASDPRASASEPSARDLCSALEGLARACPAAGARAACERLRHDVARVHGLRGHARSSALRLAGMAAAAGDRDASARWRRWAEG